MEQDFKDNPILNSPYHKPERHWDMDGGSGRPTGIVHKRRTSRYFVPIPRSTRQRRAPELGLEEKVTENPIINDIRRQVDKWRELPEDKQGVTYVTERLLRHWREGCTNPRLFFCQVEAAETFIWLNEVAPNTADGKRILKELEANQGANSTLLRYAAKMATGAGKTTVMAMLIAYHTINKSRLPKSPRFSNSFLIITPGITIKDRLRVLLPSDPNALYRKQNMVPSGFEDEIQRARIVITNYHVFKQREKVNLSKTARQVLQGNDEDFSTKETEGEMLARACKELLGSRDVVVINDEAHHCYRHKDSGPNAENATRLSGEERAEIKENDEAARLWISGIEALSRKVHLRCVYDLSATPFFLRGSGHEEGELFPWVVSDFALMDAIESGIVKLPRVPIDDNARTEDGEPMYRTLYPHVKQGLPKKGRARQVSMDPDDLPVQLLGALQALYSNYEKTYKVWREAGTRIPPVFIIVCNNTSTSKLVFDYVSGYKKESAATWQVGKLPLFSNVDREGNPLPRMNTLLIDSVQIDSGEGMSKEFKEVAAGEIENFKNDRRERFPDRDNEKLTDEDLLREVMNTVGKHGELGEQIRCVVSVSMLTEGWDANNVTHILGVRAFGTQLLCEQVVGRALRRYNYDLETTGDNKRHFAPEHADVFGVPFAFALPTKPPPPPPPKDPCHVRALESRSHLEITFPRVRAYTVKVPEGKLVANFTEDSDYPLSPDDTPNRTHQQGIIGEGEILTLDDLHKHRYNEVVFYLAAETANLFKNEEGLVPPSVFRDLVPIVRYWMRYHLICSGVPEQYLLWKVLANEAAQRIRRACAPKFEDEPEAYVPIIDSYTPEGSSYYVNFITTKRLRHETAANKCHINYAICDSEWEISLCKFLEDDPDVFAYVRNDGLGFEVPYTYKQKQHHYRPDYIVLVDDGKGQGDLLNLIVEVKGQDDDQDRAKADTIKRYWVPSVNSDGRWGRWAFVEIKSMGNAREKLAQFTARHRTAQTVE